MAPPRKPGAVPVVPSATRAKLPVQALRSCSRLFPRLLYTSSRGVGPTCRPRSCGPEPGRVNPFRE